MKQLIHFILLNLLMHSCSIIDSRPPLFTEKFVKRQKYIAVVKVIETRNKKLESNNVTRVSSKRTFVGKRYTKIALANVTSVIKSSDTSKQIIIEYDMPGRTPNHKYKKGDELIFFGNKQKNGTYKTVWFYSLDNLEKIQKYLQINTATEAPKPAQFD